MYTSSRPRGVAVLCFAASLSGCASTQLNYNTLDIADSVESIYTRQALSNLSKIIDQPNALPSQMDLLQGTVQTSASVSPSVTAPLSQTITTTTTRVAAAITNTHTGALAGAGATLSGSDAWQQNWNVVPLSDANTLRNLRALYRFVIYQNASLRAEYTVARLEQATVITKDPYALLEPQCVLCSRDPFKSNPPIYVNKRLHAGWLYWTNGLGATSPESPPPPDRPLVDLGAYGSHRLFMTQEDYIKGYLSDFVLFTLPVAPLISGGSPVKAGTVTGQGRAAPANNRGPYETKPQQTPPGIQ
jgi:hypothetical protein